MYTYKAEVIRVIDGDTIKFRIDLGFRTYMEANCRLFGINCKELTAKEQEMRAAAYSAKEYVESILSEGDYVILHSKKLDKYGRPLVLVEIERANFGSYILNDKMIVKGYAVKMED
jgi:micrococcal nuclease